MKSDMSKGTRAMAQRIVDAGDAFVASLSEMGGITKEEAERVFAYYRKHKIAKVDAVNGRVNVTHGAFLDRDTIRKAVTL